MKISKTTGIDRLPAHSIRAWAEVLLRPIYELFDLFPGVFPDACKVAKLEPIKPTKTY